MNASQRAYEAGAPVGTPELRIDGKSLPEGLADAIYDKVLTSTLIEITVARS